MVKIEAPVVVKPETISKNASINLGISREMLETPAPYTRVLAFNDFGRAVLKNARLSGDFPHVGEEIDHPYWELEQRSSDLYGLCCADYLPSAGMEPKQRVYVEK